MEVMRVAGSSPPQKIATAIIGCVESDGEVAITAIGAKAINQAVKAVAIARNFAPELDLYFRPSFANLVIDGEERTAIRLSVCAATAAPRPQRSTANSTSTQST